MESMKMEVGSVEVGLQYWLRWQVPVCAFIFILPLLVAIRLLKRPNTQPLNSTHLWLPCWTNLKSPSASELSRTS
ncbi:hypothetical protein U1Q18_039144, partial [Sarracenia purpurea var. burkii]